MSTYHYDASKYAAVGIGNRVEAHHTLFWPADGSMRPASECAGLLVEPDDQFVVLALLPQESRPISEAHPDAGELVLPYRLDARGVVVHPAPPLPVCKDARKGIPVATGFIDYFPLAVAAVAELSRVGNEQHNPGKPLHWDRSKSGDEADALMRHFLERGTTDADGVRHSTKVAWRAMAMLQKELEASK
jgi:hypothetical protein